MDTCSRLEEPGGVGWKDVNVGRLRTTTSGKRLIWSHRVVARSDLWPRNLACAIPCCGGGEGNGGRGWLEPTGASRRPTARATLPSADHAAEIARLQRENERLRMERDILKKSIAADQVLNVLALHRVFLRKRV